MTKNRDLEPRQPSKFVTDAAQSTEGVALSKFRLRHSVFAAGSKGDPDGALPPRVAARPDPEDWAPEELMTLAEAAKIHWPLGPLTARSLRTAADAGLLPVVILARKRLTNRRAIQEMSKCTTRTPRKPAPRPEPSRPEDPADAAFEALMREVDGP